MKAITKIQKVVYPWIEQYELAEWLSDPKNKAKLRKMSVERLGYFTLKLGLYDLMGEITGVTDQKRCASILLDKLPQAAKVKLKQLRKKFPTILKKLRAIKL